MYVAENRSNKRKCFQLCRKITSVRFSLLQTRKLSGNDSTVFVYLRTGARTSDFYDGTDGRFNDFRIFRAFLSGITSWRDIACRYGSVRNSRAAALPKLQRMIILRCISIAKSPDTFASEILPILNSHRPRGRLCLRIVVATFNFKNTVCRARFPLIGPRPSLSLPTFRPNFSTRLDCEKNGELL